MPVKAAISNLSLYGLVSQVYQMVPIVSIVSSALAE